MKKIASIIIFLLIGKISFTQYTLNGNASKDACNSYTLTNAAAFQSGSVWNNNKIDLSLSFDFNFDVYLGNNDAGADGIAFVLQPISTSVGSAGSGLGYENISPAVGITIDTYQNASNNDPVFDHIAIQTNGNIDHNSSNNIAGPVTAINGNDNIEDGNWHSFRITWDATSKTLAAYIDGSLRVSVIKDLVSNIFANNPFVFWGFTGSTGGANNHQQFRTALNPNFHFSVSQKRCINEPITFFDSTISFSTVLKNYWDFGDGSPIDSINTNPTHIFLTPNDYTIKQRVIGADGCEATNIQVIRIGSKPIAGFIFDNNCELSNINFTDTSTNQLGNINNWLWDFGDGTTDIVKNPIKSFTSGGNKNITLTVKTEQGCQSDALIKTIYILNRPIVNYTFTDSVCIGNSITFTNSSLPNIDPILNYTWVFNDGTSNINTTNINHTFLTAGINKLKLIASSDANNTCVNQIEKNIFIVAKPIANFKQNTICQSTNTLFQDSSYCTDNIIINNWWWNLSNGNISTLQNPSSIYNNLNATTIKLVVKNVKGCLSDTLAQIINITPKPNAKFGYSPLLCSGLPVQFIDSSSTSGTINNWNWIQNSQSWSLLQNPNAIFIAGNHTIGLIVTNNLGCKSDTVFHTLNINPAPDVTLNFNNGCKNKNLPFSAIDNTATINSWLWNFGDGTISTNQNTQHSYTANGTYLVKLIAIANNGCFSNSLQKNIAIFGTNASAGNDTITAAGQPIQLHATGGLSYLWTPSFGLNNDTLASPTAIINTTQTFTVKAFTPEGCESYDKVTINIYKGPDIYLPNAFSPNGDGLNDIFKVTPVGLKQFNYLKIFNRWGQLIFTTSDYNYGWDGFWKNKKQDEGVYVVIVNGIDFLGNNISKKATLVLIR